MTDNFKEIGSLFGREGAGVGFAKQTDKESFTYAFAWPEGDTWATLTGYLNLDEQPEEYVRRVLQDGGFRSDWDNPYYDPIGDFKETAGDEYRIPLLKVLLREQLESRYEVANHFSTMNRARVELSAFIQNEGGAPLPEDALGTPEEQGIRAMLIAIGEPPREVTLLPDENGSTLKPLQALVGGNIETFDIAFGEGGFPLRERGGSVHLPAKSCHFRHRGDGKSRVSLPARLLEGRGDGGFLHRSKRRYRSRGLRPRDRGEPVAHGWRDCPRGRVLHRYQ